MAQPIDSIENANWWSTMHGFFDSLQGLPGPKLLYWSLAAVTVLYFLILFLRRQPKNVVAYCTENGSVTVSRSAIIELVQTSCEQIQDISKPQVKIKSEGETSHFEVSIKLKSGGSLRTIEQTLQSHLRQALTSFKCDVSRETIGYDQLDSAVEDIITLNVAHIIKRARL